MRLEDIRNALLSYEDIEGAKDFFSQLGYPTLSRPLPFSEADRLPQSTQKLIKGFYLIADCKRLDSLTPAQFRIYHVELNADTLRRTDFRKVLEPFYRHFPAGNNLFVFTLPFKPYRELAFVSPQRIPISREELQVELKVTLRLRTLRVAREEPYRTDLEILEEIANPPDDPLLIWAKHESAFNVERVTKKFFEEYRSTLYCLMGMLKTSKPEPEQPEGRHAHRFAFSQLLLNRLMVCYFLARKGWMKDNTGNSLRRYFRWLWKRYNEEKQRYPQASFYDWLQVLFGDAFNNQHGRVLSAPLPHDIRASFQAMPYLNGGLFAVLEPDTYGYYVPDEVFSLLLFGDDPDRDPKLLERYNFTVDESRPYDEEMAVDPEMLGKVYESLIAEEERGEAGIFYTPRLEVDLMCRLSIVEYLHQRWNFDRKRLFHFVFSPYDPATLQPFSDAEKKALERALKECKVVDPAVGSGSFLVGMLNVLCELLDALAESLERKRYNRFELKRQLILNNLYGVDVKDWAVRACELRLFLSLLVDVPDEAVVKAKEKAEPILPNLDFRVRVGDSIVQEVPQIPFPIILRKQTTARFPVHAELKNLVEEKKALEKAPPLQLAQKEQEILQKERKIVAQLLESALKQVEGEKEQTLRKLLSAGARQRQTLQCRLADLEQLAQQIQNQRKKLHKGEPIPLFLWEVAFPEIFLNSNGNEQGFDIVIMNPPYVRQERIAPPTPLSPQDYKKAIARNIDALWALSWNPDPKQLIKDNTVEVPGRADLYVPFFFVGTALLKPKGVLCLVTSNAW
ncbi:MAG: DNA methyltransferase, partial [Candidatus Bathyarchaeia archaeon]